MLQPIYDGLGPQKAAALINWHALTGCDQTGHTHEKGKKGRFTVFLASSPAVLSAMSCLGVGQEPSTEVYKGCEEFLCTLFCPQKLSIVHAKDVIWHMFKQLKPDQRVDKLPPTPGAWKEHIRRAHVQASIWSQDLVLNPECPNPLQLGWCQQGDRLMPVMSEDPLAPDSVLQLIKCNCGATNFESTNTCTRRCSCKRNNSACTEPCHCEGDEHWCCNTRATLIGEDIEYEE